jgi:hypothetical protein
MSVTTAFQLYHGGQFYCWRQQEIINHWPDVNNWHKLSYEDSFGTPRHCYFEKPIKSSNKLKCHFNYGHTTTFLVSDSCSAITRVSSITSAIILLPGCPLLHPRLYCYQGVIYYTSAYTVTRVCSITSALVLNGISPDVIEDTLVSV